ncbi:MAG: hypothetical protein L7F77_02740 [Candidatus Magnetominusculus sp. LBB02]|nr:hypothetical protein [Candidatus Magnetominusculus sp. LBB02]
MLTQKTAKTLVILAILLFAFSFAEGDDGLLCVSLKKLPKSNKIIHRVVGFDFHVSNAKIHNILHSPSPFGFIFEVDKYRDYSGHCHGYKWNAPGGLDIDFFYDDFVVIKTRTGVELDQVNIKFSLTIEQDAVYDKGKEIDNGEVTYNFTNKDLNIRKCKGKLY